MNILPVYIISIGLLLLGALIVFRVFVRRDYLQRGRLGMLATILQLLVCGLYCNFPYTYLPAKWPEIPALPDDPTQRYVGLALALIGVVFVIAGMANLGLRRVFGQGGTLRLSGLYRFSRNPQIVAFSMTMIGVAVLWPSWYALGWILLYFPIFHMMVITEEEYLRSRFGEAYARYCAQVPRYLPLPRSSNNAPS